MTEEGNTKEEEIELPKSVIVQISKNTTSEKCFKKLPTITSPEKRSTSSKLD